MCVENVQCCINSNNVFLFFVFCFFLCIVFQLPPYPLIPAVTPLTGLESLPANLSDLPAVCITPLPAPCQYFPPGVVMPNLPVTPAGPPSGQTVNPQLVLQYETNLVPNIQGAPVSLLAVATSGMPGIPMPLPQHPQSHTYQASFQQIIQSDVPSVHLSPSVPPVSQQSHLPLPPQSHHPSITHPPDQTTSGAGNQVIFCDNTLSCTFVTKQKCRP